MSLVYKCILYLHILSLSQFYFLNRLVMYDSIVCRRMSALEKISYKAPYDEEIMASLMFN